MRPNPRTPSSAAAGSTFLFVPGDRPERFVKARAAGPDHIVLDLEDGVPRSAKGAARDSVQRWLASGETGIVRTNGVSSPWIGDDLAAVGELATCLVLPKANQVSVQLVVASTDLPIIALIETSAGLLDAVATLRHPQVVRAAFGSLDLAAEIGVDPADQKALLHARSTLVAASAACGLPPPLDGVTTSLTDADRLSADIAHARRLGFGGKLCVHPAQVPLTRRGFRPTADELRWAREVIAVAGRGTGSVGGEMVDAPVLERARRILISGTPDEHDRQA